MTKEQLIELIQKQIPDGEESFKSSVEDSVLWKDFGKLESKISWKH